MKKFVCVLCSLLATTFNAYSYEVSPMYLDLEDTGRQSSGNYTIGNVEQKTIAVEVSAFKVEYKDGEEVLTQPRMSSLFSRPKRKFPALRYKTSELSSFLKVPYLQPLSIGLYLVNLTLTQIKKVMAPL